MTAVVSNDAPISPEKITTTSPVAGPVVDLRGEAEVGGLEWGLLAVILLVSLYYLFRKYFPGKRKLGGGGGCAGCGQSRHCPSSNLSVRK